MGNLTLLLAAVRAGEPGAVDRVVAATYRELHSIARQRLSRTPAITLLDTTALVGRHRRRRAVGAYGGRGTSSFGGRARVAKENRSTKSALIGSGRRGRSGAG
jgi:hypothetical protein